MTARKGRLGGKDIYADAQRMRVLLNSTPTPGGAVDHGTLAGLTDDDHSQYVHISSARTLTAVHTFSPSVAGAPFILGANAQGQLVSGLNADQLDGLHGASFLAPQYVTLATDANLTNERVLAVTTPGLSLTDGGAGGSVTIAIAFAADLPATLTPDNAASAGASGNAARRDHVHGIAAAAAATLDVASTNTEGASGSFARADHTHDITTSSNPGAAAAILQSDASGYLQLVRLGVGTAPGYPLHAAAATEQMRLEYNSTNYASFTVASDGTMTVSPQSSTTGGSLNLYPEGDVVFDPGGNDILPLSNYDLNLGSINKKYLTLHAAELWVETLVAQNTIATIGGRILVGPTTTLTRDLAAAGTELYTRHNQMAKDDVVYLEAGGKVEFIQIGGMAITGANTSLNLFTVAGDQTAKFPTGATFYADAGANTGTWTVTTVGYSGNTSIYVSGDITTTDTGYIWWVKPAAATDYRYLSVTRNLDGSGANDWYAGDAVFNTGTTGDGFIDIYSVRGVDSGGYGPAIAGNVRSTTTYNDWVEHWAIGNLNGLYGYAVDTYGAAFGKYSATTSWLSADATNGIRMMRGSTMLANWDASGNVLIGQQATGKGNTYIEASTGNLSLRGGLNGTVTRISLQSDGDAFFGTDVSAVTTTAFVISNTVQTWGTVDLGVGDVLIGGATNITGSYIWWDTSAQTFNFNVGLNTTAMFKIDLAANTVAMLTSKIYAHTTANVTELEVGYLNNTVGGRIKLNSALTLFGVFDNAVGSETETGTISVGQANWVSNTLTISAVEGTTTQSGTITLDAGITKMQYANSGTADDVYIFRIARNSTGTVEAGFGTGMLFQLESTTTEAQTSAYILSDWDVATHASRKGTLKMGAADAGGLREAIKMGCDGSNPKLGFFGVASVAKPTVAGAKGGNAALTSLMTALANLGLVTDSTT